MLIPATTPLLPEGARTWGVTDWPSWTYGRFSEHLVGLHQQWVAMPADDRQETLASLAQTTATLLRLSGLGSYAVDLADDTCEGFSWVMQEHPQTLPWLWGNKPLASTLPLLDAPPLALPRLWKDLLAVSLPEDATGTMASLAWFAHAVAFFSWWDCRLTGRLSCGLLFQDVTVDGHVLTDIAGTGRRFGPSLLLV